MLPLRYPRRWLIAGTVIVALVAVLALAPLHWAARPMSAFNLSDKLLHMLTFAILALWFTGQYARASYWKLAVALIAFGLGIEAAQYFLPYRNAEVLDIAANTVGIVGGLLVGALGAGGWSVTVESWLERSGA